MPQVMLVTGRVPLPDGTMVDDAQKITVADAPDDGLDTVVEIRIVKRDGTVMPLNLSAESANDWMRQLALERDSSWEFDNG